MKKSTKTTLGAKVGPDRATPFIALAAELGCTESELIRTAIDDLLIKYKRLEVTPEQTEKPEIVQAKTKNAVIPAQKVVYRSMRQDLQQALQNLYLQKNLAEVAGILTVLLLGRPSQADLKKNRCGNRKK